MRLRLALPAMLAASPALADLPAPGCYARSYDAQHLAANPGQGVAALRLWFFSETVDGASPAVLVEAEMAGQGQGARDGVGGQTLTQYATCDADGACYVECDGGVLTAAPADGDGLRVETRFFAVGEADSCGGSSDLAETPGEVTSYRLGAAPAESCAALWRMHPLPEAGCYGMDYSDMVHGQGLLALRLRLGPADTGYAFPQVQGTFAVTLPDAARARAGGLGGARVSVPIWCSARDGLCRSGIDEGALAVVPLGDGLALSTSRFLVFGAMEANLDIAGPGGTEVRHQLRRLTDDACRGMD